MEVRKRCGTVGHVVLRRWRKRKTPPRRSEAPEVRRGRRRGARPPDEHIERARWHLVAADVEPRERREGAAVERRGERDGGVGAEAIG